MILLNLWKLILVELIRLCLLLVRYYTLCILTIISGGAIDPFWAMYAGHDTPHTKELLENYRIGVLAKDQVKL